MVQAFASHAALAPLRLAYALHQSRVPSSIFTGNEETYSSFGLSTLLVPVTKVGLLVNDLCAIMQWMVLFMATPFLLGLATLEMIVVSVVANNNNLSRMLVTGLFGLVWKKLLRPNKLLS
jgi:hypothetical protein